jgi:hypothetical protein
VPTALPIIDPGYDKMRKTGLLLGTTRFPDSESALDDELSSRNPRCTRHRCVTNPAGGTKHIRAPFLGGSAFCAGRSVLRSLRGAHVVQVDEIPRASPDGLHGVPTDDHAVSRPVCALKLRVLLVYGSKHYLPRNAAPQLGLEGLGPVG